MRYVCTRKCYFQDRLFEEGTQIDFKEDVKVPTHFQQVDEQAVVKQAEVKKEEEVEEEKSVERLRAELYKLGKAYDRRWGRTKLEMEITQAKKGM